MSQTTARVGHLRSERYQLQRPLGQGGFGVTYLAHDRLLDRTVVIKELFPQGSVRHAGGLALPPGLSPEAFEGMVGRFVQEARALARFNSPSVVRVQDVFQEDGTAFIVMDHLEGGTLMEHLRARGPLAPAEALRMATQLAEALALVHGAGLLHRDLKPDNVFLTAQGTPVLIDFGAARDYAGAPSAQMSVILTPGFAPVEQYAHSGPFGPPTDLYALAATLLYAITATLPPVSVARLQDDVPLPAIPLTYAPGLRAAITHALAVRASDRPANAQAFLALLQGGRDDLGALEFAQAIHAARQGPLLPAQRQRLWAQALLAVYARREGRLPHVEHPDELQYALGRALDTLPLFREGFELVYGSVDAAVPALTEDLTGFMAALRRAPEGLPAFMAAVADAAALAPAANLPAPVQVWRAPEAPAAPTLPALGATFAGFRALDLPARSAIQVGAAGAVPLAWCLEDGGTLRGVHVVSGEEVLRVSGALAAAASDAGVWAARGGHVQRHAFDGALLGAPQPFPDQPLAAAAHGRSVAVAGHGGLLHVWTWTDDAPAVSAASLPALTRRDEPPLDAQFSADGRLLLVRDVQAVTALRLPTLKVLRTFQVSGQPATAMAITADGQRVCTAHGRRVVLWDVATGRELASFLAPGAVTHVFFNPNGRLIGALASALYLLDAQSGRGVAQHALPGGRGTAATITASGRTVIVGGLHHLSLLHLAPTEFRALPALTAAPRPAPPTTAVSAAPEPVSPSAAPGPAPRPAAGPPPGFLARLAATGMPGGVTLPSPAARDAAAGPVTAYEECRLPPQPVADLTVRATPELADLLTQVVAVEGPVHRQEAFRRVAAAHGAAKVGARIAVGLERALHAALAAGAVGARGEFLWPPGDAPVRVRDRSALSTRSLDLVCDEELQAAGQLVPPRPGLDRPQAVARLLGFARLTDVSRTRIHRVIQETA